MPEDAPPLLPDYGGACLDGVVPAILARQDAGANLPDWLPEPVVAADQVVLLVLDGLGWQQLQERPQLAPTLNAMAGGPITTVAPSTTSTALTSLTTGAPPAVHGVVGYRILAATGEVLNVLRWTTQAGDARATIPPDSIQALEPFGGTKPAAVTKAEFWDSGFSRVHLAGSSLHGWRYPSTLVVHTAALLKEGQQFVYAYYPGLDTVAHEWGFGPAYDAELTAVDRLVADLLDALPTGAAVLVVSDHGQVQVGDRAVTLDGQLTALTTLLSGEGRFRWLHAQVGMTERLAEVAQEMYADVAWIRTREQVIAEGWLGGRPADEVSARLGDVALVARAPVAFIDPADTGPVDLQCRHGSLTPAEMLVPLVAGRA
jgi:predicted AlkP superfamily pyrophosphatase or phosphodiesterase